jgi:hypothetical protein
MIKAGAAKERPAVPAGRSFTVPVALPRGANRGERI